MRDAFVAQTVAGSLLSSDSYPDLEAVKSVDDLEFTFIQTLTSGQDITTTTTITTRSTATKTLTPAIAATTRTRTAEHKQE